MGDHYWMSRGHFWSASGRGPVVGNFLNEVGQCPEVSLDGAVVDDPRDTVKGTVVTSTMGNPEKDVAAFAPIDLHGQLDSGESLSLFSAQNHGMSGLVGTPRYVARIAIV